MTWNVAPEIVALVIIFILMLYARQYNVLPTFKNKMFRICLYFVFIEIQISILSIYAIEYYQFFPGIINQIIQTIYFLASPMIAILFICYILAVILEDERKTLHYLRLALIPYYFYGILVLINPFTNFLYYFNDTQGFVIGTGFFLVYLLPAFYMIAMVVLIVMFRKLINKSLVITLIIFPIISLAMLLVQWIFPTIVLVGSGAVIALLILYLYLQNQQIVLANKELGFENRQINEQLTELKEAKTLLNASLNSPLKMIILALDKNFNYLFFNQAHKDVMKFAYNKDVAIGMNLFDVITTSIDNENAKKNYALAMTGVSHSTIQIYGDTNKAYYESLYNPIFNDQHEVIGATAYARDITDEIMAKQKEKESEEKYRLLYSTMAQGVALHEIITDDKNVPIDYRFLSLNQSFERLVGLKGSEVVGKTVMELFPRTEDFWIKAYGRVALTGQPEKFENYSVELGRHFSVIAYCPKHRQFAVLVDDITDRKKKEEEIIYISKHDYLTGLYNRRYYSEAFSNFSDTDNFPLGVMMFDVNGLKIINDSFGHDVGDIALKTLAEEMKNTFETKDIVARIGGDEFAVLLPNTTEEKMQEHKEKLKKLIAKKPIMNVALSIAVGYGIKTSSKTNLNDIMKTAENNMYRQKFSESSSVRNGAIQAILNTLTEKYEPEKIHSNKVSILCRKIGEALHIDEDGLNELAMAGMFHDIGKISIPDSILGKPGKLTNEEFEIIKTHTENGYQILRAADKYSDLAIHALSHHENWDGKGYPQGLKGEQIPLFSRIICVADAFEAMTADRLYKNKITTEQAIAQLKNFSGKRFDPKIVKIFIKEVVSKII